MSKIDKAFEGTDPALYALWARKNTDRQLLAMLKRAQQLLGQHGKSSFMGREAQKQIDAAMAEFNRREQAKAAESAPTSQKK